MINTKILPVVGLLLVFSHSSQAVFVLQPIAKTNVAETSTDQVKESQYFCETPVIEVISEQKDITSHPDLELMIKPVDNTQRIISGGWMPKKSNRSIDQILLEKINSNK